MRLLLSSLKVKKTYRFHLLIEVQNGYFALDDVTFSAGCYPKELDHINCRFWKSTNDCAWTVASFSEGLRFIPTKYDSELMSETRYRIDSFSNFNVLRYDPTKTQSLELPIIEPEDEETTSTIVNNVSGECLLSLISPLVFQSKDDIVVLTFRYISFGSEVKDLRIFDQVRGKLLVCKADASSSSLKEITIPFDLKYAESIQFRIEAKLK